MGINSPVDVPEIMVDKIEKLDPSQPYRVQESPRDRNRGQKQEEEEKKSEGDKFSLVTDTKLLRERKGSRRNLDSGHANLQEEETKTISQRILMAWGVLDLQGRPRIPIIITYFLVVAVVLIAVILAIKIL